MLLPVPWIKPPGPVAPGLRIGLLGGSFNPAHEGHLHISDLALKKLGLDYVWWLVAPQNPLKPSIGMAPLAHRLAYAASLFEHHPKILVMDIERDLGTRYSIDTITKLQHRFPELDFVWLMGSDNLAQLHLWKDWRKLAREMPIAVIARPGYDARVLASPATAWLRRYRLPATCLKNRTEWSAPALIELRFDPDPRSATSLRQADPDWARRSAGPPPRDAVTHSLISDPAGPASA